MHLPPLIAGSSSRYHQSLESESKASASVADESELSCGSDYERQSKSPPTSIKAMCELSTNAVSILKKCGEGGGRRLHMLQRKWLFREWELVCYTSRS